MQPRVDFVVGNPPWVAWDTLPVPYRDDIKRVMVDTYKLAAGTESTMKRLGSAKKDLSALFVYVALDRYLKAGGRLGFVITQTLFQTTAGDEFRKWVLPDGEPVRIDIVDDWVRVRPFLSAGNKTATFVATRGEKTTYPVRYRIRLPEGRFNRDVASLNDVLEKTRVRSAWAHPSDPNKPDSFWIIRDSEDAIEAVTQGSYRPREGVSTALESVFRLRVEGLTSNGQALVENVRDRAKRPLPAVRCEVEVDLLYPYLTGAPFSKWFAVSPACYLVPHTIDTGMRPLSEAVMKSKYPLAFDYLSRFKEQLEERSLHQRWGKSHPFYSLYNIGPYTFAPWKVVWKRSTKKFEAAVASVLPVADIVSAIAIPSNNVMMLPFGDETEAHFVCALLNNSLARAQINASITTKAHADIISTIPIPLFDASNALHRQISEVALGCAAAARRGDERELHARELDLDKLVATIWGASPKEIESARAAVARGQGTRS